MPDAASAQGSAPAQVRHASSILAALPALILILSAYVPLCRQLTSNDMDWPILLDELYDRGLAFGRDIVFTYGPWGFVWSPASSRTLPIACVIWAMLGAVAWWSMVQFTRPMPPGRTGMILLLLAIPLGGDYVVAPDVRLLLLPFLLLLYHFFLDARAKDPSKLLLVVAVAVAGMIKFTSLVAGGVVVFIITIDQLLRRKPKPWELLTWLGAGLIAWLAGGQSPLDLLAYIRYSLSMTAGYADVMSLDSANESRQVLAFFLPTLLMMLLLGSASARGSGRRAWLLLGGMLILLMIVFRCGYVRHDLHELTATMLLLDLVGLAWLAVPRPASRVGWGLCLIIAALGASQSLADWHKSSLPREVGRTFRNVGEEVVELARLRRGQPSMVVTQRQQMLDHFKSADPLPAVQGDADLYPRLSVVLLANGIPLNTRPTLQSYAATTPALTALNANSLSRPNPPQNLFISTFPQTEHLPTLLDNASWPQILGRYRLVGKAGNYLHLTRRDRERTVSTGLILETQIPLGDRLELPPEALAADGLLWAQIQVRRSLFGSLMAQLYKPPQLSISVITADGRLERWRFVPSLGADGFLLGPIVTDPSSTELVLSDNADGPALARRMPRSIAISPTSDPHGHWHYQPQVTIRLHKLRIEPAP